MYNVFIQKRKELKQYCNDTSCKKYKFFQKRFSNVDDIKLCKNNTLK